VYLLADANDQTADKTMKIFTEGYPVDTRFCFSFSYFMKGTDVGTLQLRQVLDNWVVPLYETVWRMSGNQGNQWRTQRLVIKESGVVWNTLSGTFHVCYVFFHICIKLSKQFSSCMSITVKMSLHILNT